MLPILSPSKDPAKRAQLSFSILIAAAMFIALPARTAQAYAGTPYGGTPWSVPGTIQSENYDVGGEGVAYHSLMTTNPGHVYRFDGVGVENCPDTGGGYNVGWTNAGQWLNYSCSILVTTAYTASFRVSSPYTGTTFHLEDQNGNHLTGSLAVPNTGSYATYTTVNAIVNLTAGLQYLHFVEDTNGFNINYMSFAVIIPGAPTSLTATAGNSQIALTWQPGTFTSSYNIYRGTTAGGEGSTPVTTNVQFTNYTDTNVVNGTKYYYKVAGVNSGGTSPQSTEASATPAVTSLSIDSGGGATGSWAADEDFTRGSPVTWGAAVNTSLLTGTIPPQSVLQSDREGTCTYTIPGYTANSAHTVTLYFVEQYWNAAGKRTFNVIANGTTELSNFDIFAAAGAQNKAVQKSFTINANSNGQIVLQFNTVIDNAKIGGITVM